MAKKHERLVQRAIGQSGRFLNGKNKNKKKRIMIWFKKKKKKPLKNDLGYYCDHSNNSSHGSKEQV